MDKILCFEYVLYQLSNWYRDIHPTDPTLSSFTRLKVLKLLFFVSAIHSDDKDDDLLDIFNNFYAMQHGPVESDIYNAMVKSTLKYYNFKSIYIQQVINPINISCFNEINQTLRDRIDTAIQSLRNKNEKLITYTASNLVNLSHQWESWQIAMHIAESLGKGSEPMDISLIRSNCQYFSL